MPSVCGEASGCEPGALPWGSSVKEHCIITTVPPQRASVTFYFLSANAVVTIYWCRRPDTNLFRLLGGIQHQFSQFHLRTVKTDVAGLPEWAWLCSNKALFVNMETLISYNFPMSLRRSSVFSVFFNSVRRPNFTFSPWAVKNKWSERPGL